jgi:hypothetical protein
MMCIVFVLICAQYITIYVDLSYWQGMNPTTPIHCLHPGLGIGFSGRVLAYHVQGPGFNPQYHNTKSKHFNAYIIRGPGDTAVNKIGKNRCIRFHTKNDAMWVNSQMTSSYFFRTEYQKVAVKEKYQANIFIEFGIPF